MDFKRTTDIQVVQNTNHITLDDLNSIKFLNRGKRERCRKKCS
jgi:hypothetical protein